MSQRDWRKRTEDWTSTAFGAAAMLGAFILLYSLGLLNGRESERRQKTPASYSQAAKADAQRTCVGLQVAALFECVYERVEAGQEQARGEQDLGAQQRAASSALASAVVAFLTLIVSIIGVWFVKRTLEANLNALEDTTKATEEMIRQNATSEHIANTDLRPWLKIKAKTSRSLQGDVKITVKNLGRTAARNVRVCIQLIDATRDTQDQISSFFDKCAKADPNGPWIMPTTKAVFNMPLMDQTGIIAVCATYGLTGKYRHQTGVAGTFKDGVFMESTEWNTRVT